MKTIKRIVLTLTLTILSGYLIAQNTSVTEAAYVKSYESEKFGNYDAAINTMKTIYKADSYIANIRLYYPVRKAREKTGCLT